VIVELKPSPERKDSGQSLLGKVSDSESDGIKSFLRSVVLPHAADAWCADILALEKETEGLLGEIIGDAN